MLIFDTITSLATPRYKSALALIRLSGDKTKEILSHIIRKDVGSLEPNKSYLVNIYRNKDEDYLIDQCVLTFYKGPRSYTGYDSADFSIHGNMIIADELMDALCKYGARRAFKGEFSAQAYYSGKMDLLKAQGINDLINANSLRAKMIANKTLNGKNSQFIKDLKARTLDYISQLEYYIEDQYTDEKDDYDDELSSIKDKVKEEISKLNYLIDKIKSANRQYDGISVSIVGEPNVGKSTLLNALIKEDKAIVSPIPGTTRDVVEGNKEYDGILFKFKDTAGLRKTSDLVENLGIKKSYKTIENSDIVLLCSDCGFNSLKMDKELKEALEDKEIIKVSTKRDLKVDDSGSDIKICSLKDDLNPLIKMILNRLNINDKEESEFLGKREEEYLIKIKEGFDSSIRAIDETLQVEIVSDELRKVVDIINDFIGESEAKTMEDIYETLFSNFCLGK